MISIHKSFRIPTTWDWNKVQQVESNCVYIIHERSFWSEFYYLCFWLFFYARTKTEEGGKIHVIILRNYTITTLFRLNDRIQQFCLVSQAINVWTKNGSNFTIDHFSLFCCCYFYFFDYYLWESKFSTLHFVQTLDHTRAKQLLLHTLNIKLKSKCSIFHTICCALQDSWLSSFTMQYKSTSF